MAKQYKRENFDVTPEQEAEIDRLRDLTKAASRKDAMMSAVRLSLQLASESRHGNVIYMGDRQGKNLQRVIMPDIEQPESCPWKYLVERPHSWKKQLYVKGRRLPAANVWSSMLVNKMQREEAAYNWDLPVAVIDEIVEYCEANKELLQMEADEEAHWLAQRGIPIEPPSTSR